MQQRGAWDDYTDVHKQKEICYVKTILSPLWLTWAQEQVLLTGHMEAGTVVLIASGLKNCIHPSWSGRSDRTTWGRSVVGLIVLSWIKHPSEYRSRNLSIKESVNSLDAIVQSIRLNSEGGICSLYLIEVTTPKVPPPPPLTAQNRSVSLEELTFEKINRHRENN